MNNFQKQQAERILSLYKSEESTLEKGGEGSRGGKIIGHTISGKPIYESYNHPSHKNFSQNEHREASNIHYQVKQSHYKKGEIVETGGGSYDGKTRGKKENYTKEHSNKYHHEQSQLHSKHEKMLRKEEGEHNWTSETPEHKKEKIKQEGAEMRRQLNKDGFFDKSEEDSNDLEKGGKRAVVGEVRTYSGQKWVKHSDGWVHVSDKKKILEKPGGKREEASEDHVNHFHTHSRRQEDYDIEEHHRRLHQAGIENLKTQDFKVHAKYGDNTGGRESLETNFKLFPKQNPDRGPEEHRLVKLKNDSSFTSTAHAIMTKERAERSVQEDRGEIVGYFDKDGRFNETGEKEEPTKTDLSPVELLNKKTKELSAVQDKLDDHHKGVKELEDGELKSLKDKKDILVQVVKKLEAKSKVSDKVPEDKKAVAVATKDVKSEEMPEEDEKPKKGGESEENGKLKELEDQLKSNTAKLSQWRSKRQNSIHPFDPQLKVSDYVKRLEGYDRNIRADIAELKDKG